MKPRFWVLFWSGNRVIWPQNIPKNIPKNVKKWRDKNRIMKKKISDIVLKNINPPDYKTVLSSDDLAEILVQRLGLQRKVSQAKHAKLLKFLMHAKKNNTPLDIETIADVLGVSVSQTYEELRKWRTLRLLEFVRVPVKDSDKLMKGYLLAGSSVNQLVDRATSSINMFIRQTRRIAKDFDDYVSTEVARKALPERPREPTTGKTNSGESSGEENTQKTEKPKNLSELDV
jgi:hypothetical protein